MQPNHDLNDHAGQCCRRDFLKGTLTCGAYTLAALAASSVATRKAFAQPKAEAAVTAPFARVETIADGVWAVISTPAADLTTIANGAIIAGDDAVLLVEGFQTVEGASWLNEVCKELTGRRATHVALTHYHADHSNGLAGYMGGSQSPSIVSTTGTRDLLLEMLTGQETPDEKGEGGLRKIGPAYVVPDTVLDDTDGEATIDLGGKVVKLRPYVGHTPSDMTIELLDPHVVWCGDLFFNGFFPNYRDSVPSSLRDNCRAILGDKSTTFVPGHGAIAGEAEIASYLALLDTVEEAARAGLEAGKTPEEIAQGFTLPESLGNWMLYDPGLFQWAFEAWKRDPNA